MFIASHLLCSDIYMSTVQAQSCIYKPLSEDLVGFSMPLATVEAEDCTTGNSSIPNGYIVTHAGDPSMMNKYIDLL
jgi:hypothetical protein